MPRGEKGDSEVKQSRVKLEDKLIENIVELQKVHTNLLEKFDNLSGQISGLSTLFEMTAKSFASQPGMQMTQKDREFLEKIDKLLEQNKTIAKGLTLMEERIRERAYGSQKQQEEIKQEEDFQPSINTRPLPKF